MGTVSFSSPLISLSLSLPLRHHYCALADSCYTTVCSESVMARYSSSVSKYECPASVWATITAEVAAGGGSGPAPTEGGSGGGGSGKNGSPGLAAPIVLSLLALSAGLVAVML